MMTEFQAANPDTRVRIYGVNDTVQAVGNDLIVQTLPMFQDTGRANVWSLWNVTYRDVVILDQRGRKVGVYNLTEHDLQVPDSYAELKQMIGDIAGESADE